MDNILFYDPLKPEVKVEYTLIVTCDDEEIYTDTFTNEESLQEEGLRKADHAIEFYTRLKEEEENDLEEDYA